MSDNNTSDDDDMTVEEIEELLGNTSLIVPPPPPPDLSTNRNGHDGGGGGGGGDRSPSPTEDDFNSEDEKQYKLDQDTFEKAKVSRNFRNKLYGKLIHTWQGYEADNDGVNGFDLKAALTESAIKGQQLGAIDTGSTADMYNGFLHTNLCSKILRIHSDKVGDMKLFKADDYIRSIQRLANRDSLRLLINIHGLSKARPASHNVIGTFVRATGGGPDNSLLIAPEDIKKDKKTPIRRRKRQFDENLEEATQYENLASKSNTTNKGSAPGGKAKPNRAEVVSSRLLKVLRDKTEKRQSPLNIFEFAINKEDLAETVSNLFHMGFLLRDGHAGLTKTEPDLDATRNNEDGDGPHNLTIHPDVPPAAAAAANKKSGQQQEEQQPIPRGQHILSFSARVYRELCKVAQGETEIDPNILASKKKAAKAQANRTKRPDNNNTSTGGGDGDQGGRRPRRGGMVTPPTEDDEEEVEED